MSGERDTYNAGADLVFGVVSGWLERYRNDPPRFRFPPRDIALIADLRDVGAKLAINDSARGLVECLIVSCVVFTGQAPTAMMLRVILEGLEQPIEWVSLSELGVQGVGRT